MLKELISEKKSERDPVFQLGDAMPRTITNTANVVWNGDVIHGSGTAKLTTSGAATLPVAWKSRGEESGATTTPEELIAAAHATCFSMRFASLLVEHQTPPTQLHSSAEVSFVAGTGITGITLNVVGTVANIDDEEFQKIAAHAAETCPVSRALSGVTITHSATLN